MDQDAEQILQFLMMDMSEENQEDLNLFPDSDHDNEDHQSDSDRDTVSLIDDIDANPDFVLGSGATSVVESSSSEDENVQEPVPTRPETVVQDEHNRNTCDEVIEAVVAGTGGDGVSRPVIPARLINYLVGKDKLTMWKKTCYETLNVRTRTENIIRQLPGPVNNGKNAKTR